MVHQIFFNANVAESKWRRNNSEKVGSSLSTRTIAAFPRRMIEHSDIVNAVAIRTNWPAKYPSAVVAILGSGEFFALFGYNGQLDPPLLEIKDGLRRIALREDLLFFLVVGKRPSFLYLGQKNLWIEKRSWFRFDRSAAS